MPPETPRSSRPYGPRDLRGGLSKSPSFYRETLASRTANEKIPFRLYIYKEVSLRLFYDVGSCRHAALRTFEYTEQRSPQDRWPEVLGIGCFPTSDMQKSLPPLSQKCRSLQKKMRNVLRKMMGVKFHIAYGRCGNSKRAFWAPKKSLSSNVAKLAGYSGFDLALIFCMNDFYCAILSFWDMIDFALFLRGGIKNRAIQLPGSCGHDIRLTTRRTHRSIDYLN